MAIEGPEPPELERSVGLLHYRSRGPGIGGKLKAAPEDFLVQEVSDIPADPLGSHVVFTLRKRRWDTLGAILRIASELGLDPRAFGYAGNKDRHAVTEQKVSVTGADIAAVSSLSIPGIEVLDVYRSRRKIRPGMLRGNRFTIAVRAIPADVPVGERIEAVHAELGGLVPNYLGIQRFGSTRPNNHIIGRALVEGDLEGALAELLWAEHQGDEPEAAREARRRLAEDRDFAAALSRFPAMLSYERMALAALAHGRPPVHALRALPRQLLRMMVHAYQGFLFNRILSIRMERGLPLDVPVEGDVVLIGWKTIPVDPSNLSHLTEVCRAGRASVSLPLPGPRVAYATGVPGELERGVIEGEGIDLARFSSCIARSEGTRRGALARYDGFVASPDDDGQGGLGVTLRFDLPKGSYATCVAREFLKGPVW